MIDWFLNLQNLIFYVLDLIMLLYFFWLPWIVSKSIFGKTMALFLQFLTIFWKLQTITLLNSLLTTEYTAVCARLTEARSEAFWHIQRWVIFQNSNCHWRNNRKNQKKKSWNKSRIKNDKWCCVRVPKSIGF